MSLEVWGDEGDVGPEGYITEDLAQEIAERAFRNGAEAFREMAAVFIQHAGHPRLAESIRANWNPVWGDDPIPTPGRYEKAMAQKYRCWDWE